MPEVINVKILHLVLKKKWYEMQESGEKTEEYREITPYWRKRLKGLQERKKKHEQIESSLSAIAAVIEKINNSGE